MLSFFFYFFFNKYIYFIGYFIFFFVCVHRLSDCTIKFSNSLYILYKVVQGSSVVHAPRSLVVQEEGGKWVVLVLLWNSCSLFSHQDDVHEMFFLCSDFTGSF